jgi:hypothetical protein
LQNNNHSKIYIDLITWTKPAYIKNYPDNSDDSEDDVQEAVKTLEIGKQLGLYADFEDKVLKNLTKLRRSSRRTHKEEKN